MNVILTEDFKCAPEGHTLFKFKAGSKVSGKVAEMALSAGVAKEEKPAEPEEQPKKRTPKPKNKKPAKPKEAKPENPEHEG